MTSENNTTSQQLRELSGRLTKTINQQRHSVFSRFPILFTLLGTFGLVATFYGFEGIIDQIALFKNNPVVLLVFGLILLAFTGQLYKKLNN